MVLATAVLAIVAWSCEESGKEVDKTKPTIGIEDAVLEPNEMVAQIMIIPSSDATAWFWKIEAAGQTLDYQRVEGALGALISGSVEYGVEYTVSAYAVKGDITGDIAKKSFCFLPEEAADITIGEPTLDKATMKVSATMYPSKMTEKWYWRAYDMQGNAPAWNQVDGNNEQSVEFDYLYGKSYTLEAYAEHVGGKSEVRAIEVYFEPAIPSITVSEPRFDGQTMSVSFDVTPSEDTHHWYWGLKSDAADAQYTTYEGAEPATVSYNVEFDKQYDFIFRAENIINGGSERIISFKQDSAIEEPLVAIAIENLTAYTLDAVVTKADHCTRYVAGAVHTSAYDREEFIEQALTSLNPDVSYPFMVFNTATESMTFSEQTLVKNATADSDLNAGIILLPGHFYTIAVYGEDEIGRSEVYTTEVTIPEPVLDGNVGVELNVSDVSETTATVNVTAQEPCKMIIGYIDYASADANLNYTFEGKSDDEAKALILSLVKAVPESYTEPINRLLSSRLPLESRFVAYAIAIKDGKIGDVAYEEFSTITSALTGKAKITSATIAEQTSHESLEVTLTADANARKVRLYAAPSADHMAYADNMEYVMGSSEYQNYREEYAYEGEPLTVSVDIYHPGDNYYLYAVAVDEDDKAGEIATVAMLAGYDTEYYSTIEEIVEEGTISFNGSGEVKLTADITVNTADQVDANITVEYLTSNINKVWLYRINEGLVDNIESTIKSAFANYPTITGAKQEVKDGDKKSYQYMIPYHNTYGGTIIVAVVLDNNDKFNINTYYVAGIGVQQM